MARTKQTAAKSTGGFLVCRHLDHLAERVPTTNVNVVSVKSAASGANWGFIYEDGSSEMKTKMEAQSILQPEIYKFCNANRGLQLTAKHAAWWGLLDEDNEPENRASSFARKRYSIKQIRFNPSVGTPTDEHIGIFEGRPHNRGRFFPIKMYTLDKEIQESYESTEKLRKLFGKCIESPMKWFPVNLLGSRSSIDYGEFLQYEVRSQVMLYRSSENGGCVPMAAASCVHRLDPWVASIMGECQTDIQNLADFARYVRVEVRTWSVEDPLRILARNGGPSTLSHRQRLEWLLTRTEGLYLVQTLNKLGENNHIIGIDCELKLLYDTLRPFALKLCCESIELCAGKRAKCIGVGELRELKKLPSKKKLRRRKRIHGVTGKGQLRSSRKNG